MRTCGPGLPCGSCSSHPAVHHLGHESKFVKSFLTTSVSSQWAKDKQRLSAGSNQETWRATDIDGRLVVDVVRQAIAVRLSVASELAVYLRPMGVASWPAGGLVAGTVCMHSPGLASGGSLKQAQLVGPARRLRRITAAVRLHGLYTCRSINAACVPTAMQAQSQLASYSFADCVQTLLGETMEVGTPAFLLGSLLAGHMACGAWKRQWAGCTRSAAAGVRNLA